MMDFKAYFKDELNYLYQLIETFSEDSAEAQQILSQLSADPSAIHLLEGFAFLSAHLREKLDDAFPEITQNLLAKVWAVPLYPLPAISILQVKTRQINSQLALSAGSTLVKKTNGQPHLRLTTTQNITIQPLSLINTKLTHTPEGSALTLSFKWHGKTDNQFARIGPVSLFLGQDTQQTSLLALWFAHYLDKINVSADIAPTPMTNFSLGKHIVQLAAPNAEDGAFSSHDSPFWRLQQVTQHYLYPDYHQFITFDFSRDPGIVPVDEQGHFHLTCQFNRPLPASLTLNDDAFLLHCLPVINRYPMQSHCIPFAPNQTHYTLAVPPGKQIIHLLSVASPDSRLEPTYRGRQFHFKPITEFAPTYHTNREDTAFYEVVISQDVTHQPQYSLKFYDSQGLPLNTQIGDAFFCRLLCCDQLDHAQLNAMGELESGSDEIDSHLQFHTVTPLSSLRLPIIDSHDHWDLISHLSLSPALLANRETIGAILQDLHFYARHNRQDIATLTRHISGISQVQSTPCDRLDRDQLMRGLQLTLTLDPNAFQHEGDMFRFGQLIAQVFPYCLTQDQFLEVKIRHQQTGEIWTYPLVKGDRSPL